MNTDQELYYHFLNLDYSNLLIPYDKQTNKTLDKKMNNFIHQFKKDFEDKVFILEYNDDLLSLISYKIIKTLQNLCHFKLQIYGKIRKTKEYFIEKEIICKKIPKENYHLISVFNPIYKVINACRNSNKLIMKSDFCIIDVFTPEQFKILSEYYGIKNIKMLDNKNIKDFSKFCQDEKYPINKKIEKRLEKFLFKDIKEVHYLEISLTGDSEEDFKLFDEILITSDFCTYNISNIPTEQREDYIWFLKNNLNHFIQPNNMIRERRIKK